MKKNFNIIEIFFVSTLFMASLNANALASPATSNTLPTAKTSALTQRVNVNTADEAGFRSVKGLGAVKARAILAYRAQHGAFKSIEDLTHVPGIGPKFLEKIKTQLTL